MRVKTDPAQPVQISLRVSKAMYDKIKIDALINERSVAAQVRWLLQQIMTMSKH